MQQQYIPKLHHRNRRIIGTATQRTGDGRSGHPTVANSKGINVTGLTLGMSFVS